MNKILKNIDIQQLQNIEEVNLLGIKLYKKEKPFYKSKLLGVDLSLIALIGVVVGIFSIVKKRM